MSAAASSSKTGAGSSSSSAPSTKPADYRSVTVDDDDDDDDLDDLDDVLDSFNAPPKSNLGKRATPDFTAASNSSPAPVSAPGAGPSADAGTGAEGDDEFEASLIEGMESLLRSLANENSPAPMADAKGGAAGGKAREATPGLSSKDEEEAFERAVQMMLSGEGMDAMGLDGKGKAGPSLRAAPAAGAGAAAAAAAAAAAGGKQLNFEETIKKAMASVNAGGAGTPARDELPGDLAALLKQLGDDPSALDGFGDDEDDLGGLLDGMMAQLMSKEVLEEPMGELAAKYPGYLEKPPAGVSAADLEKYRKQHELVKRILDVFKRPNYSDDTDGKEVAKLVGEMQDLGGPPNEIMGDLPDGFDMGALGGGEEGCVIM